jgi:tetratricopeptide (TPR) repeat protein
MNRLRPLALLAFGLLAGAAHAQEHYDRARRAVEEAQALQASGRWSDAQVRLAEAAQGCGSDLAERPCRLLVRYSSGYLSEIEAAAAEERRKAMLEAAVTHYRAVLAEAPQHEATLRNLASVYRRLDRAQDAEALLQQAVAGDGTGTGGAAMLLGQFYREEGRTEDAMAAFERAAAANPASAAAPQAIVALHADAPPEKLAALLPRLVDWEGSFPAVAEEGYRRVLRGMTGTPPAEQALLAWVSVVARQGWIAPANFAGLPRGWTPVEELLRYAGQPEAEPSAPWWMQLALRRSVLAELALAEGQAAEVRSVPSRSLRRLQVGMRIAPEYEEYLFRAELKRAWPSRLELARAQLALLAREPALDPGARLQQAVINELFVGKAGAYRSENLEAMQRFHVTLGRWYAERRQWAGNGSTTARFQLERAIGTAAERAARGEPYQPMQEEKLLLAGGYEQLGERAKASDMYLRAAEAFLDTDQLEEARDALGVAQRLTSGPPGPGTEMLQRVIATRGKVVASAQQADPADSGQAWLRTNTSQPFLIRQRFKVFADLAERAQAAGMEDTAASYAGIAFETALRSKSLVGTADLVRLDHARTLALARADTAQRRSAMVSSRALRDPGGEVLPVYVPNEGRATYVSLSADAILAGRFDAALRREPALSGKPVRYSVDNGQIRLRVADADPSVTPVIERLRGVPGVRSLALLP